ncbi:DUF5677 domain-containing protein [Sphingobium chlorophenolicum]|uniref:Uncharacterized protein n=1 Tax=Sphingobium chlorophenolicum TaxID=46429 RepID=A0A081RDW8_SPHCR|nr:DUF5677 domain-containing protein [Sphingobium chlorophenolicum]KEQ53391.1 hypothetical protein BV95_02399 [Sphingobium chlorophenolicum]
MGELTDEAGKEFDADFKINGYLANAMRHIQAHIRTKYPESFAIADELNKLGQAFYVDSTELLTGRYSHDPLCVAIQLIPRALSAYQASILSAERGMHVEALTLARSIYETAFWLGFLHKSPDAAKNTLFAETIRQELEVYRLSIEIVKDNAEHLAETRSRMSELGKELKKYPNPSIKMSDLADKGGFGNRYTEYRMLCGKAAHVSVQSTIHYLNRQDDGSFNGHIIGPDEDAVPEIFAFACGAIIMVIEAMRWLTKDTSRDSEFQALMARYAETMVPTDAVT